LIGKARHVRTVPVPDWVQSAIDSWLVSAGVRRPRVSVRLPRGQNLGKRRNGAGRVARREGMRQKGSHYKPCPA
jgi:hypothetical protein